MKNYFILLFCTIANFCFAQYPVITSSNVLTNYSACIYTGGFSDGQSVSTIVSNFTSNSTSTDIVSSTFPVDFNCVANYPTANRFRTILSGSNNNLLVQLLSSNGLYQLNNKNCSVVLPNPWTNFSFPMTYSSVGFSSNHYNEYFPVFSTPVGTYTDVVSTIQIVNSGTMPINYGTFTTYYTVNPFRIIMELRDGFWNYCNVWDYNINLNNESMVNDMNMKIYPNPSNNFITIDFQNNLSNNKYKIFDIIGRNVKQGEIKNGETINIEELNSGNYIIEVVNENQQKSTNKFIKL